jgi:hypothetical protein
MTFLLWSRVQQTGSSGSDLSPHANYQKADPPPIHKNNLLQDPNNAAGVSFLSNSNAKVPFNVERKRKTVLAENTDEFLLPVLKDFAFSEVDLASRKLPSFDDYDDEIADDLRRVKPGLGDGGVKATVPTYQEQVAEEVMKKEAFNRILSEMISPNRSTPDTREPACRSEVYDIDTLPDMSVVIIFTNEAFTSLVRTLHSVVNRTPNKLLKEIILVDDFSDHRDLKGKLERYIAVNFELGKIRLIRLAKRSGLIRARMIGAHLAIGDVLLFLDAHCEAIEQW